MAEAPWRQAVVPPGAGAKYKSDFADPRPEPPPCVQNAMMTKDKKPFTYTPGGIDLSEIRSPRMARRLERNAMSEGVSPPQQLPQNHTRPGPLPPSALAAMQPQLPVQVFPTGKVPQLPHGPPPPPPPPMTCLPPLPLDGFERPDMTKIIPDNPMALLRKTQGPVVKQDPILNKQQNHKPQDVSQPGPVGSTHLNSPQSPPSQIRAPPAFYKRQPSLQQNEPQTPPYVGQKSPPVFDQQPESPRTPNWLKRNPSQEVPEWAVNEPKTASSEEVQRPKQQRPWSQKSFERQEPDWVKPQELQRQEPQQRQWQEPQQRQWTEQQRQEPQRQRPEQQRQEPQRQWPEQQRQEPQRQWPEQQRQEPQRQWTDQQKQEPQRTQQWHEQQPHQHEPQRQLLRQPEKAYHEAQPPVYNPVGGVRQQVKHRENPQEYQPGEKVEVVIVNEPPLVFQHPGQFQQQQQQQQYRQVVQNQGQNVRIIPVQVEGTASNGHSDPRHLNRQLSQPTQSNTFKVLQKITNTNGDDGENEMAIEHSPIRPHNFPQQNRMNFSQGDQELMNKFRQGIDEANSVHKEIDPRYRGPHIPSKAFKLLQSMTGGPDDPPPDSGSQVEQNNHGPKVRTIPIQIEGGGNRLPPSEQTVAEPKKYMGSSIPSRSFKILQAMTSPDQCGPGQSDL